MSGYHNPSGQDAFEQVYRQTGGDRYGQMMQGLPGGGPAAGGVYGAQGLSNMNPILAAAMRSYGPMNWQGAGQFAQQANYSQMPASTAMMLSGHQNFAPQVQGAMGQIGGVLQGNADRIGAVRDQNLQAQLLRENRHDSNEKFTMLFKSLFEPTERVEYRDLNGNIQYRQGSPLLEILRQAVGPRSTASSSASLRTV